jgi:hypothetical protein
LIATAADRATLGASSKLDIASRVVTHAATAIKQTPYIPSTDALTALLVGGMGCCTSHANLACAMLRAKEIPARTLSVYPASGDRRMQMHFIVEAYFEDEGWLRAETSAGAFPIGPNAHILMRTILADDENKSIGSNRLWTAAGVPYLASFEADKKDFTAYKPAIDPKTGADHISGEIARFKIVPEDNIADTFGLAKKYWTCVTREISNLQKRDSFAATKEKIVAVRDLAALRRALIEGILDAD